MYYEPICNQINARPWKETRFALLVVELGRVVLSVAEQAHREGFEDDAQKLINLAQLIFDQVMGYFNQSAALPEPDD